MTAASVGIVLICYHAAMKDFFHGWRRKVGVVTLVMACVLAAAWVRTFFFADQICFLAGPRKHYLTSSQGGFAWLSVNRSIVTEWHTTIPAEDFEKFHLNEPLERTLDRGLAILDANGINPTCHYLMYWWLVMPLTLLSAYLILWTPRKQPSPK